MDAGLVKQQEQYISEDDNNHISQKEDLEECRLHINTYILGSYSRVPVSIQTDMFFFLEKYTGRNADNEPDFLCYFYDPVWSVIYHLTEWLYSGNPEKNSILTEALTAQGLSLMLHSLDDHICDGEIPLSHTLLIYRNEIWNDYVYHVQQLGKLLSVSDNIFRNSYNRYCSGISCHDRAESLEEYFSSFKLTMELGCVAPRMLMAGAAVDSDDIKSIIDSLCSFGLAWRIQDDIEDTRPDIHTRKKTAVYFLIDSNLQKAWLSIEDREKLYEKICCSSCMDDLVSLNDSLIDSAQKTTERYNLTRLGIEYSRLHFDRSYLLP